MSSKARVAVPQTQGKIERFHQILKEWLTQQPPARSRKPSPSRGVSRAGHPAIQVQPDSSSGLLTSVFSLKVPLARHLNVDGWPTTSPTGVALCSAGTSASSPTEDAYERPTWPATSGKQQMNPGHRRPHEGLREAAPLHRVLRHSVEQLVDRRLGPVGHFAGRAHRPRCCTPVDLFIDTLSDAMGSPRNSPEPGVVQSGRWRVAAAKFFGSDSSPTTSASINHDRWATFQ